jgi:hypothetical protein
MPKIAEVDCISKVSEIMILPVVFYAVNIAKNAESNVESIRNSDTFEAFYSLNMPKFEGGCPRYRIEILIHSGPFIPRIAVIGCQRSPILPGLKNRVDFRRRCIKIVRARELFPANFAFRCFAYNF